MPNIKRLTALLEYVEKLPLEAIEMTWFRNECNTAGCLMGHATVVFPERFKLVKDSEGYYVEDITLSEGMTASVGWQFFELTFCQWSQIFGGDIRNDKAVENLRNKIKEWSNVSSE